MIAAVRRRRIMLGLVSDPTEQSSSSNLMFGIAAVAVPAHGFVVGSKGLVSTGAVRQAVRSPVFAWIRKFLGACLWASAIAAGMLIYTTFTAKWQAKGYPVIPISALAAMDQATAGQSRVGNAIPLAGSGGAHGSSGSQPRKEKSRQTSFLDEYEG
jgi:hypothetical protein